MAVGMRARQVLAVVRLRPFDTSTEQGRSRERARRIALAALATAAARVLSIGTALFTIPLTLNYLGPERYGLWMTILSFVAVATFADLGIGNGLLSVLSECDGRDDKEGARAYVAGAGAVLAGVCVFLIIAFLAIYPLVPWATVLGVSEPLAAAECGPAIAAAVICSLLAVPLSLGQKVQNAYQDGFAASIWAFAGSLLSLTGVLIAIYYKAGLVILALGFCGAPLAAHAVNSWTVFRRKYPFLMPHREDLAAVFGARVARLGAAFLILHVCFTIAMASDNIVAAHVLGHEQVARYSVVNRLFSIILTFAAIAAQPLWPAYGEAAARGDIEWTRRALRRSVALCCVVTAPLAAVLVLAGGEIVRLWTGIDNAATWPLAIGMGVWAVLSSLGALFGMFLNGLRIVRLQVVCAIGFVIGAVIGKLVLARFLGAPGIVWANVLAYTAFIAIPYSIVLPKRLRGMRIEPARI